jgi:hypothetical protein
MKSKIKILMKNRYQFPKKTFKKRSKMSSQRKKVRKDKAKKKRNLIAKKAKS